MKYFMIVLMIFLLRMVGMAQQPFVNHPLENLQFKKSDQLKDIAVFWKSTQIQDSTVNLKLLPYNDSTQSINQDLSSLRLPGDINQDFDFVSADFLDNNFRDEEIVVGYIDKKNGYAIRLYLIESMPGGTNSALIKNVIFTSTKYAATSFHPAGYKIRVYPIQIDADPAKELLLAYWDANFFLNFVLFDQSNDSVLVEVSSFTSGSFGQSISSDYRLFAVSTDDFDRDGMDEILLVGPANVGGTQGEILAGDIFDIDNTHTIIEKSVDNLIYDYEFDLTRLDVASGKCNPFVGLNSVVAFQVMEDDQITVRLKPFSVPQDLSGVFFFDGVGVIVVNNLADYYSLDLEIADIMGLGDYKEVIVGIGGVLRVYSLGELDELTLLDKISYYNDRQTSVDNRKITVKNLNKKVDPSNPDYEQIQKAEIAIVGREENIDTNNNNAIKIYVYQWNPVSGQLELILEKIDSSSTFQDASYPIGIISGGYPPYNSYLGEPTHFQKTDILQPMVILNAPPVHFDQINGTVYDINSCYNGGNCSFSSVYQKTSTITTELTTQIESDWTYSYGAAFSLEKAGIKLETELTNEYGEHFSNVQGYSKEITISLEVTASEDDRIYAVVADYDVWEYPVYIGGEFVGYMAVVVPNVVENRWFPSKSWSGITYVPDHEVGNILSYPEYAVLEDNPLLARKIKGSNTDNFVLDANSSYVWSLEFADFQSNQVETSWSNKQSANASMELWGLKGSVSGSYEVKELETQKTTVKDGIALTVNLGALDVTIGEVNYRVTPYTYWATNGALVLDYSVQPELSAGGGTPTWWQVEYEGNPDPSFILPWKLDPEKGFTLQDEEKRRQTKEIRFKPENPRVGDTTTISLRIFNFSLTNTPGPVKVRLYLGNPDSGASQLIGANGETDLFTSNAIPARGFEQIQVDWVVPQGVDQFQRIYAVIDPDNEMTEIHENNNVGWTVLSIKGSVLGIEDTHQLQEFQLLQNFPNPFNPVTTIRYSLSQSDFVSLQIFNIAGQLVKTLVNGKEGAGQKSVFWDATNEDNIRVSSGIYIYRLKVGQKVISKKMILLK
jgi:hypothetical protein